MASTYDAIVVGTGGGLVELIDALVVARNPSSSQPAP